MAAKEIAACQHADHGVERIRVGPGQVPQVGLNLHPLAQALENLRALLLVARCLVPGSPWAVSVAAGYASMAAGPKISGDHARGIG